MHIKTAKSNYCTAFTGVMDKFVTFLDILVLKSFYIMGVLPLNLLTKGLSHGPRWGHSPSNPNIG